MLKRIAQKALRSIGFQITRIPEQQQLTLFAHKNVSQRSKQKLLEALTGDPLNASLHYQHADFASKAGNLYLAYAELKTAQTLGAKAETVERELSDLRQSLPNPKSMNHNQYFRFVSLAAEIVSRAGASNVSILDVGGGRWSTCRLYSRCFILSGGTYCEWYFWHRSAIP